MTSSETVDSSFYSTCLSTACLALETLGIKSIEKQKRWRDMPIQYPQMSSLHEFRSYERFEEPGPLNDYTCIYSITSVMWSIKVTSNKKKIFLKHKIINNISAMEEIISKKTDTGIKQKVPSI